MMTTIHEYSWVFGQPVQLSHYNSMDRQYRNYTLKHDHAHALSMMRLKKMDFQFMLSSVPESVRRMMHDDLCSPSPASPPFLGSRQATFPCLPPTVTPSATKSTHPYPAQSRGVVRRRVRAVLEKHADYFCVAPKGHRMQWDRPVLLPGHSRWRRAWESMLGDFHASPSGR